MTAELNMTPQNLVHERIEIQHTLAFADWLAFNEGMKGCKVVLDIGANDGGMFNSFVSNGAQEVHAFEPVPSQFAKAAATFGHDRRWIGSMVGISDVPGSLESVNVYNAWTLLPQAHYQVGRALEFKDAPPFQVEFTTVDIYVKGSNVAPDFIKIDVDGYERRVLMGALATIAKYRPPMLFELSYLPSLIGDNCEALCKLIFELGYVVVTMDGKTVVRDWISLIERFPWRSSFDVMLFPKEKL